MKTPALSGLDLLPTAVVLVDAELTVRYLNPAAENLFEMSSKNVSGQSLEKLVHDISVLQPAMGYARTNNCSYTEHELELGVNGHTRSHLSCTVTPVDMPAGQALDDLLLLEFRHVEGRLRIAREERILDQSQANRELIRNLAHEIRNPLGGIRGAAQLLDRELDRPDLCEYTQVIMKEADRLQLLLDRLLTPHRLPQPAPLNVHEVLDRVRSVILAEYRAGIAVERDYDVSLPPVNGDKEQLIQAVFNVARNAAQALQGQGQIRLKTRIMRQITLARRRYRHAIAVDICDNGPGIPDELRERVFHPLVSGRAGGSGLGLTLAQTFITQHHGMIYFESAPGETVFTILLPVEEAGNRE
ncbi:MAG: nitrogen regulation protein NR(II) [Betaproteobacteria bacterium]|nr:nitrogen regulation protein NR(II) [Betaproteobacteria bacterium]